MENFKAFIQYAALNLWDNLRCFIIVSYGWQIVTSVCTWRKLAQWALRTKNSNYLFYINNSHIHSFHSVHNFLHTTFAHTYQRKLAGGYLVTVLLCVSHCVGLKCGNTYGCQKLRELNNANYFNITDGMSAIWTNVGSFYVNPVCIVIGKFNWQNKVPYVFQLDAYT